MSNNLQRITTFFLILLAALLIAQAAFSLPSAQTNDEAIRILQANGVVVWGAFIVDPNWEADDFRRLHDYVLDERERLEILGPGSLALYGMTREFTWYVRDGYLIRSPVRHDGVAVPEPDRRRFEEQWLRQEQEREERRLKRLAEGPPAADAPTPDTRGTIEQPPDFEGFVRTRGEPRFVSAAYFLDFKFEPGNYYLVGRDTLDGHEVLRVEYYPTNMFGDDPDPDTGLTISIGDAPPKPQDPKPRERKREKSQKEKDLEATI